jgi:hypothetical protein
MKRSTLLAFTLVSVLSTASAFATGSIAVTNAAAMDGTTFGLAVTLTNSGGGPAYVQDATPNNEGTYRALFFLDPNTLNGHGSQTYHTIFSGHNPGDGVAVFRVDLYQLAGGNYRIRGACRRDDGTYARTTLITIGSTGSTPARQIQIEWGSGASSGFCTLTGLFGANPSVQVTGVDNDTLSIRRARLGAVVGMDAGTDGTYWLDEFESFR